MTIFKTVANASLIQLTNNPVRFAGKNYADNDKIELFEDGMLFRSNREMIITIWAEDNPEFSWCHSYDVEMSYIEAKNVVTLDVNKAVFIDTALYSDGLDGDPDTDDFEDHSLTIWFNTESQAVAAKQKFFAGKNGKMVEVKFIMPTGDILEYRGILNGEF